METDIKKKIQKILSLADATSNSSAEEISAALNRAKILLEKYNLSLSEVLATENETASSSFVEFNAKYGKIEQYQWTLVCALDSLYDTFSYLSGNKIKFVGLKTNVNAATLTYEYLIQSVEIVTILESIKQPKTDKKAFRQGVADTVFETVKRNSVSNGSIVKLSNELIEKYKKSLELKTVKTSSNIKSLSPDYLKGKEIGKGINPTGLNQHIY